MRTALIAGIAVTMLGITSPGHAAPAGPRFDGRWLANLVCPASRDAAGFIFSFDVAIRDGVLHGQYGQSGQPGNLVLDGVIEDDGSSKLTARGLTGAAGYTVGNVRELTPYVYHLDAQFGVVAGRAARIEVRPCTMTFSKY